MSDSSNTPDDAIVALFGPRDPRAGYGNRLPRIRKLAEWLRDNAETAYYQHEIDEQMKRLTKAAVRGAQISPQEAERYAAPVACEVEAEFEARARKRLAKV